MTVRNARVATRSAGTEAASSRWLQWLARSGLTARGVNYMLVGLLAVQIAVVEARGGWLRTSRAGRARSRSAPAGTISRPA